VHGRNVRALRVKGSETIMGDELTRLQWLRDIAGSLYASGYLTATACTDAQEKIDTDIAATETALLRAGQPF
jgi:hypothetical protein